MINIYQIIHFVSVWEVCWLLPIDKKQKKT